MDEILKALLASGPLGIVLGWFMWVQHNDMGKVWEGNLKISEALDRSTRTDLLRLIASPHVAPDVKEAAAAIMTEVEDAKKARTA